MFFKFLDATIRYLYLIAVESCLAPAPGAEAIPGLDAGVSAGPLQRADLRPGLGQDQKGEVDAGVEGA